MARPGPLALPISFSPFLQGRECAASGQLPSHLGLKNRTAADVPPHLHRRATRPPQHPQRVRVPHARTACVPYARTALRVLHARTAP
eukprot:365549-Chlamydomonas_euryale.AAC.9